MRVLRRACPHCGTVITYVANSPDADLEADAAWGEARCKTNPRVHNPRAR